MMRDDFFCNWHTFGSRKYRYKDGRWIPTTEEIFAVELDRYNRRNRVKYETRKWTVRLVFFVLGVAAGVAACKFIGVV